MVGWTRNGLLARCLLLCLPVAPFTAMACTPNPPASTSTAARSAPASAVEEGAVIVHVKNEHMTDATVHLHYEGGRTDRLGTIAGFDEAAFRVPAQRFDGRRVKFGVELLGGRDFIRDHPFMVSAGDRITFRVMDPVDLSNVMIHGGS